MDYELDENSFLAMTAHCEKEEPLMNGGYHVRNAMYRFNATTYWKPNLNIWDIAGI